MTLWLILTLFLAAAALVVLAPFFFGSGAKESPTSLDVYKDQLGEVDRDLAQGLIDEVELTDELFYDLKVKLSQDFRKLSYVEVVRNSLKPELDSLMQPVMKEEK